MSDAAAPANTAAITSALDLRFMQLALSLGRRGLGRTWPNPAVGAVVVKDDVIVGRGWTQPGGRPHAETEALKRAGKEARGATLYVTLEPCSHQGKTPPCVDAIIRAGIARVVSALEDPNPEVAGQGYAKLRERGIAVDAGLEAAAAARQHAGHIRRMRDGRPQVLLKLAATADGKDGRLDLNSVLKALAGRGITRLMVEGGPTVAAAFIKADLVDEAALFRSPNPLGEGVDVLEGLPLTALTKSPKLRPIASEVVGGDTLEMFERM
jgi:pyrimidine deaminase RibD-like protein